MPYFQELPKRLIMAFFTGCPCCASKYTVFICQKLSDRRPFTGSLCSLHMAWNSKVRYRVGCSSVETEHSSPYVRRIRTHKQPSWPKLGVWNEIIIAFLQHISLYLLSSRQLVHRQQTAVLRSFFTHCRIKHVKFLYKTSNMLLYYTAHSATVYKWAV